MSHCRHRESFLLDQNRPIPEFLWWEKARYLCSPSQPAPLLGTERSRLGTFCRSYYLSKFHGKPLRNVRGREGAHIWMCTADDVPTWITLLEDVHSQQRETVMNRYQHQPHDELPNNLTLICISSKPCVCADLSKFTLTSRSLLCRKDTLMGFYATRHCTPSREYHSGLFDHYGTSVGYDMVRLSTR